MFCDYRCVPFTVRLALLGVVLVTSLLLVPSSFAASQPGAQRLSFRAGPYEIGPGQNRIQLAPTAQKPKVNGYIVGIRANLRHADGSVPRSDRIMFHHGVWLNLANRDATMGGPERFFAVGEEKTDTTLPKGYGYAYRASDPWLLNYMVHNLVARPDSLYITYDIDFVPASSPAAASIKPARPVWMDVENGKLYPVFDVFRGAGRKGKFTYPTQNPSAYAGRRRRPNKWRVDRDSVMIATAGHLHAGGLWNDLYLKRKGARYRGPNCAKRRTAAARARCRSTAPSVRGNRVRLFRSRAKYFEPLGPVSWDLAMTVTPQSYRVRLKKGDVLSTTVTYESKRASWYESMGIMVAWLADGRRGLDPFRRKVDVKGKTTHGHLRENRVHGGKDIGADDPSDVASGAFTSNIAISNFGYRPQRFVADRTPVVRRGQSITFTSTDAARDIYHSVTSCRLPCNRSTGIGYPTANGPVEFDSGQLGFGGPPTPNRNTWSTPKRLKPGTYAYFCRIHPSMRGAFRVKK